MVGLRFGPDPINLQFAANVLPLTQRFVVRGDVCNGKMSFNTFYGKAEIESLSN